MNFRGTPFSSQYRLKCIHKPASRVTLDGYKSDEVTSQLPVRSCTPPSGAWHRGSTQFRSTIVFLPSFLLRGPCSLLLCNGTFLIFIFYNPRAQFLSEAVGISAAATPHTHSLGASLPFTSPSVVSLRALPCKTPIALPDTFISPIFFSLLRFTKDLCPIHLFLFCDSIFRERFSDRATCVSWSSWPSRFTGQLTAAGMS